MRKVDKPLQTKKILVIGPESRLGDELLRVAKSNQWLDVLTAGRVSSADFQLELAKPDISEEFAAINDIEIGVVFGGMAKIAECDADPALAMKVNCESIQYLMENLSINKWVFFSTNLVFSGDSPFTDKEAPVAPFNIYGETKAAMESCVLQSDKDVAVVRMTKVLYQSVPLFGDFIRDIKSGDAVSVFRDMTLAPVFADDVMRFLMQLIQNFEGGIYHLSGSEDVSYSEVLEYCAIKLGLDASLVKAVPKTVDSPKFTSLKVDNRENKLGFYAEPYREVFDKYLHSLENKFTRPF